jgi:hypothetical protein
MSEEYDGKSFDDLQHAICHEQEAIHASSCLDVHRSSCIAILDAIEFFLLDWELSTKNNNPVIGDRSVAETSFNLHVKRFLLTMVSIVVSTLGPGDSQLRDRLLNWLSLISTTACRQILLDALPAVLPPRDDGSSAARSCTRQVVMGLQSLLTNPKTRDDSSSIIQVLECLSFINSLEADRLFSGDDQPSEVVVGDTMIQVAIDALPMVAHVDLPILVRLLIRNISSAEQARNALIACRMEPRLWEGGAHSMACVQEVQGAIQNGTNGGILAETYINLLEEIVDEVEETLSSIFAENEVNVDEDSLVDVDGDQDQIVILDVAVLAILRLDPEKKTQVATLLDSMFRSFVFNWDAFMALIRMSKAHPDTSNLGAGKHFSKGAYFSRYSTNNNSLETGCLSLAIFFLLSPLRVAWVGTKKCKRKLLGFVQQAIVELYHHSNKPLQKEIVECLFQLSEEVAHCDPSSASATLSAIHNDTTLLLLNNFDPRHRLHHTEHHELQSVYKSVQAIVLEIAREDPSLLLPFKDTLLGQLSRRDSCSMEICHACTLLSLLFRPARGAGDHGAPSMEVSEFLTVIWRLLFAPDRNERVIDANQREQKQSDKGRVARGMAFATALVQSRKCCHEIKISLFEWVTRIVLPPTHRMLDSETGLHALHFLLVLQEECKRESRNGYIEQPVSLGKAIFQATRVILGNMGLVRVLPQYEGKRGILGYTSRPKWLVLTVTRPPKVRSMVFCFDAFTRNEKMLHPCEWHATSRWIFDLLNSYLRLGRERFQSKSSSDSTTTREKWTPHGWVEAAIEFPVVLLLKIKVSNKRQQLVLEWLQTQTTDFEFPQKNLQRYETISDIDIWELIAEHHKDSDFNVFLQSLFRFSLSLISGIGVSVAVLQNSFEHSRNMRVQHAEKDACELRQAEATHLLYYQLLKIYTMQRKCLSVKRIFLALKMGSRRQHGRATSKSRKRRISEELPRQNEPLDENLEHVSPTVLAVEKGAIAPIPLLSVQSTHVNFFLHRVRFQEMLKLQ